jgi:hypothetical protein
MGAVEVRQVRRDEVRLGAAHDEALGVQSVGVGGVLHRAVHPREVVRDGDEVQAVGHRVDRVAQLLVDVVALRVLHGLAVRTQLRHADLVNLGGEEPEHLVAMVGSDLVMQDVEHEEISPLRAPVGLARLEGRGARSEHLLCDIGMRHARSLGLGDVEAGLVIAA